MSILKTTTAGLLCLGVVTGCGSSGRETATQSLPHQAVDFSLSSVAGGATTMSDMRGKVVVLDFWASWCPPCRQSLPHLQQLSTDSSLAKKGLVVLAINEREDLSTIRSFLGPPHYSFPVLLDAKGSVARAYDVSSLPTTFVIQRDGSVSAVIAGFTGDSARQLDDAIFWAIQ